MNAKQFLMLQADIKEVLKGSDYSEVFSVNGDKLRVYNGIYYEAQMPFEKEGEEFFNFRSFPVSPSSEQVVFNVEKDQLSISTGRVFGYYDRVLSSLPDIDIPDVEEGAIDDNAYKLLLSFGIKAAVISSANFLIQKSASIWAFVKKSDKHVYTLAYEYAKKVKQLCYAADYATVDSGNLYSSRKGFSIVVFPLAANEDISEDISFKTTDSYEVEIPQSVVRKDEQVQIQVYTRGCRVTHEYTTVLSDNLVGEVIDSFIISGEVFSTITKVGNFKVSKAKGVRILESGDIKFVISVIEV